MKEETRFWLATLLLMVGACTLGYSVGYYFGSVR